MNIRDEILINSFGQGIVSIEQLIDRFAQFDLMGKRVFLNDIVYFIMQSKARYEDSEMAITESRLKPTFTSCVMLRNGIETHNLNKLVELPEAEINRVYILLVNLFKTALEGDLKPRKGIKQNGGIGICRI